MLVDTLIVFYDIHPLEPQNLICQKFLYTEITAKLLKCVTPICRPTLVVTLFGASYQ